MTKAEVTQLFAVLALAYPSAELFKAPSQQALMEKLAPTIALWSTCLRDVDFWTGQQAVVKVCQTCKYPPSIAELREAADTVSQETRKEAENAYLDARRIYQLYGRDRAYDMLASLSRFGTSTRCGRSRRPATTRMGAGATTMPAFRPP